MFELLIKKIATAVVSFGSMFLASITGVNPSFENVTIIQQYDNIVCSAELSNCFSDDFNKIFNSGQTISITFIIRLYEKNNKTPLVKKEFYHQVKYDLVDRYYEVYLSEIEETFIYTELSEVKNKIIDISDIEIIEIDELESGKKYYIEMSASLPTIYLDAVKRDVNLMIFWNFKKPTYISDLFERPIPRL